MTSIRKFVYATLLAFTALSFAPTLASAEGPARGEFKLTHEVHWQNAVVPAGEYSFTYNSDGVAGVLMLSKLSDPRTGFIFLVSDTDDAPSAGVSHLALESTPEGSYVSALMLPELGMTLHFTVPAHPAKPMARTATTVAASGQ